jgi:hypothetical protein
MNGEAFLAYVEQALVPELRPRDIVSMDNLPAHKVHGVTQAIEAARCAVADHIALPACTPRSSPSPAPSRRARIVRGFIEALSAVGRKFSAYFPPPRRSIIRNIKSAAFEISRSGRHARSRISPIVSRDSRNVLAPVRGKSERANSRDVM